MARVIAIESTIAATLGAVVAFGALGGAESCLMSLLSKVVSPALARGVCNSGLLATEAGTAGRAAGDFILAFALKHCDGHAGRRALLGVLFPPSAAAIVLSIAMTRAMWDSLV